MVLLVWIIWFIRYFSFHVSRARSIEFGVSSSTSICYFCWEKGRCLHFWCQATDSSFKISSPRVRNKVSRCRSNGRIFCHRISWRGHQSKGFIKAWVLIFVLSWALNNYSFPIRFGVWQTRLPVIHFIRFPENTLDLHFSRTSVKEWLNFTSIPDQDYFPAVLTDPWKSDSCPTEIQLFSRFIWVRDSFVWLLFSNIVGSTLYIQKFQFAFSGSQYQ